MVQSRHLEGRLDPKSFEEAVSRVKIKSSGRGVEAESVDYLKKLAADHPEWALEAYLRDPELMQYTGFLEVSEILCQFHPDYVARWLGSDLEKIVPDEASRLTFVTLLLSRLGGSNPSLAMETWDKLVQNGFKDNLPLNALLRRMSIDDMSGTLELAKSRFQGNQLNDVITAIASGNAVKDPVKSFNILSLISEKRDRNVAMAALIGGVGSSNYDKIAAVVSRIDAKTLSEIIISDMDGGCRLTLFKSDPALVRKALDVTVLSNITQPIFSAYITQQMSSDPESTLNYANELPSGIAKDQLLSTALATWSKTSFDQAIQT